MVKDGRKELQMGCLSPCYPVIRKYTVKQNSNRKKYLLRKYDAKWAKESFSKSLFLIWKLKLNIKSFDSQFYYRMPYLAIKILSKMFYSTVGAGILQTPCSAIKWGTFCKPSENLISRIFKKSGNISLFTRTLEEIYDIHF